MMLSIDKFGRYKAEVEKRMERSARLALRNRVKLEKHFGDMGGD